MEILHNASFNLSKIPYPKTIFICSTSFPDADVITRINGLFNQYSDMIPDILLTYFSAIITHENRHDLFTITLAGQKTGRHSL